MVNRKPKPIHFFAEPVTVQFSSAPVHLKKPHCPDRFIWRDEEWQIIDCIAEWKDYHRRGRMARNMQPQHARAAEKQGSWGVGRYYFDVRTKNGRCFRLYFDRAPSDAFDRTGNWVLLAEISLIEDNNEK